MGWRIVKYEKLLSSRADRPEQWPNGAPRMLIPTDTDPEYKKLVRGPYPADNLAGWVAIVAYYSRQNRGNREDGKLWCGDKAATVEDIADTRGLPEKVIERAIHKLLSVGWLEEWDSTGIPESSNGLPNNPCGVDQTPPKVKESKVREGKEKESKETYIHIPNCKKVELTQESYDWLVTNHGKTQTDNMILEAEDFFIRKPKDAAKRNHKLTINNWLTRKAEDNPLKTGELGVDNAPKAPPGKYAGIGKR